MIKLENLSKVYQGGQKEAVYQLNLGMGMTPLQVLYKIEIPLAFPVIIAGIQTAAVIFVGTAVVSNLIGAGGLGRMIFTGLAMFDSSKILLGSFLSAIIAITIDQLFEILKYRLKVIQK